VLERERRDKNEEKIGCPPFISKFEPVRLTRTGLVPLVLSLPLSTLRSQSCFDHMVVIYFLS